METEQLSLFGSLPTKTKRKRAPRRRRAAPTGASWDLWSQQAEREKYLTLFFLDIRNFTSLSEKCQPFHIINIVRKMFAAFQNLIRKHHGKIIETTGDGFYAAFGFNRDPRQAANDAVRAGMAILTTLDQLNSHSFETDLRQRLEVGIGLHAGKVATGTLVLNNAEHPVVMGYPVNVASRIQSATKEFNNNFIVSSAVYQALDHPPDRRLVVVSGLKGVKEPVELHLIGKAYPNTMIRSA